MKSLRRFLAVVSMVVLAGDASAWAWQEPAPQAILKVSRPDRGDIAGTDGVSLSDLRAEVQNHISLMKSPRLLRSVISSQRDKVEAFRVLPDPLAWLQQRLEVEALGDGGLIKVTCGAKKAVEAATVINAVVDAYMKETLERNSEAKLNRFNLLKDQLATAQETSQAKRMTLWKLRENNRSDDLHARAIADRRHAISAELVQIEIAKVKAGARLERLKSKKEPSQALKDSIEQLEDEAAILASQEKGLAERLEKLEADLRSRGRASLDLSELENEIASERAEARRLSDEIARLSIAFKMPLGIQIVERAESEGR